MCAFASIVAGHFVFIAVVFTVVSVHHHHAALFTIFSLPVAPPLPRFGKFASIWLGQVLLCAKGKVSRKEKKGKVPIYSNKKRQGANILNKKRKRRKGKAAPYKATELHLGGRSFPLLGATPFPCFGIWCNILPYFRLSSFGKKNSGCCEPP